MEKDQLKQDNKSQTKQPQPSPKNCTTNHDQRVLKRDEWSEGAVSCLLEAYESKWSLRNRAKLKGHDWDDVAKHVSARTKNSKSPKTLTQCKNKIESMKKRYRSESGAGDVSSWPLYSRLDLLLRGNGNGFPVVANLPPPAGSVPPNSSGSNGVGRLAKGDEDMNSAPKLSHQESSTNIAVYSDKDAKSPLKTNKAILKRKREERADRHNWEIGKSIRWLAEVVVRSEQARMETMKEMERIRVQAEEKRGEVDLKRTEIIANTQLEIAKLFLKGSTTGVDSALRVGRS